MLENNKKCDFVSVSLLPQRRLFLTIIIIVDAGIREQRRIVRCKLLLALTFI